MAVAIVLSLVVAGVAGVLLKVRVLDDVCPGGVRVLDVAVTPVMAPVVTEAADRGARGRCWHANVTARPAADVLDGLRRGVGKVDVWIPDSSMWVRLAARSGVAIASEAGPLAMSPVVLAMPAPVAKRLGWPDQELTTGGVLRTGGSADPVAIGWPDPERSALATAALLELEAAASRSASGRMDLAGLMRGATKDVEPKTSQPLGNGELAVPLSEQSVWADNTTSAEPLVAAYSGAPGSSLDYPFVVTKSSPETTRDAADLLAALTSESGRHLLQSRGFRDPAGRAGPALRLVQGIDPSADVSLRTPSMTDLSTARSMLGTLGHGSRILAVVDVSGSMGDRVPGSGLTRLGLTIQAASAGLALLPAQSEAGLWEFSTDLEHGTDYRELVPIGPVAGPHAARLARRLTGLQPIPTGSTGLYDTVLAAVRRVRSGYDPTRTNAVVLLTDGANHDAHGIGLAALLDRLRAENDPSRPVPVISVAYGPDSDAASLRAISDVTDGATYVAADPRKIRSVLLDAIGQRLCRPNCGPVPSG